VLHFIYRPGVWGHLKDGTPWQKDVRLRKSSWDRNQETKTIPFCGHVYTKRADSVSEHEEWGNAPPFSGRVWGISGETRIPSSLDPVLCPTSCPVPLTSVLVSSFDLPLNLPSGLFLSGFAMIRLGSVCISHLTMLSTCPVHPTILDLITLKFYCFVKSTNNEAPQHVIFSSPLSLPLS
jgi:hypothetical protein